jgi:hypothetical protein
MGTLGDARTWCKSNGDKKNRMTKTTFDIPNDLMRKFNSKVNLEYGGRQRNKVLEKLIMAYVYDKEIKV